MRDPLKRLVSVFLSKVYVDDDPWYHEMRDCLISLHGIDLSPEADPAPSSLALARMFVAEENPQATDAHFRPQYLNLGIGSRFKVDTILRIEDRVALIDYSAKWVGRK